MRNIRNKFLALLLITSVAFLSCKKEDPIPPYRPPITNTSMTTNNPTFNRGQWRITLFQESASDQTNDFSGYMFVFNSNGIIHVTKDSTTINGNWSFEKENDKQEFLIKFSSSPLNELNNNWKVKGETFNELRLENIVENGEADHLTFRRNQQE